MKIALIAPSAIPARTANSIQTMKMAQALSQLGNELRVFAPGSAPDVTWETLARHYGLRTEFELLWLPTALRLRGYSYALKAVLAARRWGADLIYTRVPQAAAYASLRGLPTILEVHDLPAGRFAPLLLRLFLRGAGARRLLLITQALAAALGERFNLPSGPTFTLIAPDGVDLEPYEDQYEPEQARQDLGLPSAFTVGYTGHLYAGRGADLLLALAARLPEIYLLLVGGEPHDVARLQAQAEHRGLENLNLFGFVPNAELPRYQAACELFLMPYQSRVAASSGGDIAPYLSPMKMFEYLACGRPIIASDLPVLQEVLTDEVAVILPPDEPEAWAGAIESLKGDVKRREQMATRARALARGYTWQARARRMLAGL